MTRGRCKTHMSGQVSRTLSRFTQAGTSVDRQWPFYQGLATREASANLLFVRIHDAFGGPLVRPRPVSQDMCHWFVRRSHRQDGEKSEWRGTEFSARPSKGRGMRVLLGITSSNAGLDSPPRAMCFQSSWRSQSGVSAVNRCACQRRWLLPTVFAVANRLGDAFHDRPKGLASGGVQAHGRVVGGQFIEACQPFAQIGGCEQQKRIACRVFSSRPSSSSSSRSCRAA
jgi:hypothetical protein